MLDTLAALNPYLPIAVSVIALIAVAWFAELIVNRVVLRILGVLATRSRIAWDDALMRQRVIERLVHATPALVIYLGIALVPGIPEVIVDFVRNVASAFMILMLLLSISAGLRVVNEIYESLPIATLRPMTGFIQLLQIVLFVTGGVLIVAVLIDRDPLLLLSGLGAMTAVLLLVFKDTILGLVASVQLTAQDMVRVGDWVEVSQYGADGDVTEVGLHTVKVQNFDRTITTIPTYRLISESFKNWRGMAESGGRRIKRALLIDQSSIRFLQSDEVDELRRFVLLRPYIDRKRQELAEEQQRLGEKADSVNRRRLTNVGTFRAYVFNYLRGHEEINEEATLLVRQLAPRPEGLPLEIYCFTHTTNWRKYEEVQADVFDHMIAIATEFDLHLYQQPSGRDVRDLGLRAIEAG